MNNTLLAALYAIAMLCMTAAAIVLPGTTDGPAKVAASQVSTSEFQVQMTRAD